jgi:chromosome segregation ATPase
MGKFVGVALVLFVLAVGYVALTQGTETAALISAFDSASRPHEIAWAVIVLVPLLMVPVAAWLWDTLVRQRRAATALGLRLDGVRGRIKDLRKAQDDVEAGVEKLTRSDPEDALDTLQRRMTEAERFAEVQKTRSEAVDLETRIGAIRDRQQALQERLAPVLDARRGIEKSFAELDVRQGDIERSLTDVASGEDGVALDIRLKNLNEFLQQGKVRCDHIERASKTVAAIGEAFSDLAARLAPFAAAEDGITQRIRELNETSQKLAAGIDSLERAPEGALTDRVQRLADDRRRLDDGISHLSVEFYKLASLRKDAAALSVAFEGALNLLSLPTDGADADGRIQGLSRFIEDTQHQFEGIERRVIVLDQLRTKLADLQSRLVPLESGDTGVVRLVADLTRSRDDLLAKIRQIEGGEGGDLAARVKLFAENKSELEARVAGLSDQFAKLATIRNDIAGLFAKLNSAVEASSQ